MDKVKPFEFKVITGSLYQNGQYIGRLNSVEGRILVALVESTTELIERDALLDIAWPDKEVTPNSLNVAIRKIRNLFIPTTKKDVIVTHFKKGFSWNKQYVVDIINTVPVTNAEPTINAAPSLIDDSPEHVKNTLDLLVTEDKLPAFEPRRAGYFAYEKCITLIYYCSCTLLILFILTLIAYYATQASIVTCYNIKNSQLCGYGVIRETDVPAQLSEGKYIYVNSNRKGFIYAEIK